MNPAAFTLRNTRTALVIYAALLALGIQTFFTIGRLEYPEFTIRSAQVVTSYPGRSTLQVEQQLSEPIEQALRQMAEIKSVNSTSKNGVSIVGVEVHDKYFDLAPIWQKMRNKVNDVRLPDGAQQPIFYDDDFADIFPYIYALSGDGFTNREMVDYAETIRDEILKLDGVARVDFHGALQEKIYVEYSSNELAALGFTPSAIAQQLANQNAVASSGDVLVGTERLTVATLGEFESIEELETVQFSLEGAAGTVMLKDFATVRRSYEDPPSGLAHLNGERVVTIAISMQKGGVVTEVGERIEARLAELQSTLPIGLEIERVFFQPEYVSQSISSFLVNLGQAFFFVVLVMLLFAGLRIALVVGVLVPSAILLCFAAMPSAGVQLEMMSIAALIIALGLLVDNAVVVSEQILVRMGEGEARRAACIGAVKNLTIPLLAASGTTIAAFSPVALAPGGTSEFTYSLFAVVSITLLCSWLLSITIIPMFCYYLLKPLKRETFIGRLLIGFNTPYEMLLRTALQRRWIVPLVIAVLTVGAAWAFKFVPSQFFPPNERGQFIADFSLPLGRDIIETEIQAKKLETWLLEAHGDALRNVTSWIGNGGPRWYLSLSPEKASPNYAFFNILTKSGDPNDVRAMMDAVSAYAHATFPDARVTVKALETGPPVGAPIQIRLYGSDLRTLYRLRDQMQAEMEQVEGVYDIRDDWDAWVKQLTVNPDPGKASRLGLSTQSVAAALNVQYKGQTATIYREGDDAIPVIIRSREDFRDHPERMRDMPIYGGESAVPLSQVAEVSTDFLPGSILREDTVRTMTIKAEVRGRFASAALAEIQPRLAELERTFPPGYHIEYGGEQEESAESSESLSGVMPISFGILALILIAQFNSIRRFGIIVCTIPPMIVGITPGLLLTGSAFGFMTLLGVIALLGIIVNNAILLIDEVDTQQQSGLDVDEAIIAAAKSRLRPIIMTTVTTIIGLMPLAIAGGGMWRSMANAMMFGLGFGTVLTLVLCPVLMSLCFRKRGAATLAPVAKPKKRRKLQKSEDSDG